MFGGLQLLVNTVTVHLHLHVLGVGVSLAMLGVYSVLSYAVAQRMREFAIRAAVGATRSRLVTLVLREGALLSGIGILLGTGLALQASGLLKQLLYGVSEFDVTVFMASAAGLGVVAALVNEDPAALGAAGSPAEWSSFGRPHCMLRLVISE